MSAAAETSKPVADRPWALAALTAIMLGAVVATTLLNPQGLVVSRDPGYEALPVPLLLVPTVAVIVMTLVLPRGRGGSAVIVRLPSALRSETAGLLALAVGFPLLGAVMPTPEDWVLLKAVMFLIVPGAVLAVLGRRRGPSVLISRPVVPVGIIVLPALLLGVLTQVGPFSPGAPATWPPLAILLIGATATAITAGLGEELMFRRFLQTRLEALAGRWTGILVASILFGLMHTFSHGDGALGENAVRAIAMNGTTGLALGLMWSRWRRIWVCVLAHVLLNGFGVLLHLAGLIG
ncbi:CPBP family intramembrane metalloprotease [Brachybacterium muris]|uniref:CPBP family intramembrane glutamic endopeptidase n=1 Tax=Brachybacterium muris TaxID=219301 RepID=UPI00195DF84F|nr:CPBP family intramembrane glutamic endopeptidase [Brachybacterium muris]MBM7499760.1 membrane protease YdiL (CAAX protease family) [Brachybacterium muris]MCT1997565.1 CPBP family intramembrane metalloprotease [Brachybacterium muris]MCT2260883.1 CPBP family intramembrane metalloprotease [Brachybacterium muris]